jgi:hypothetical protein
MVLAGSIHRIFRYPQPATGGRGSVVYAKRLQGDTVIALWAIAGRILSLALPTRGENITRATY